MSSSTRTLFIGSYGGSILTATFNPATGALTQTQNTTSAGSAPSWQEISPNKKFLYTVEEHTTTSGGERSKWGAVSSYRIVKGGGGIRLERSHTQTTIARPVSLGVSPDGKTIFTAHYSDAAVEAISTNPETGSLTGYQKWKYKLSTPGAVPERQEMPHPHQALFDPTGAFVLVPDLGADLVRIYHVYRRSDDNQTVTTELTPFTIAPGTGPRHGVFYPDTPGQKAQFYYLIGELMNVVLVYAVGYSGDGDGRAANISLTKIQSIPTLPPNTTTAGVPPNAGEILISPHGTHLYASNRHDTVFSPHNSIAAYSRHATTGKLELIEIFDSGVTNPRHISLDPGGDWFVAEGQDSGDMKIFKRNKDSGKILTAEGEVARLEVNGGPVCVKWLN